MRQLDVDSGTSPDLLPARILKVWSEAFFFPVFLLCLQILETRLWPAMRLKRWIVPLYKNLSVYNAAGYRDIHLTVQISKVMERLIQRVFVYYFRKVDSLGPGRGAFGKVCSERLLAKIRAQGAHPRIVPLIASWLRPRTALVAVGGTEWKPRLYNIWLSIGLSWV